MILKYHGVNLNLLINFEEIKVINPDGIEVDGKKYYTLIDKKYTVVKNTDKNVANVDFTYTVENYGEEKYKIIVSPVNVGDIKEGIVKYKKSDLEYWTAAKDNKIIVNQLADYDIIYIDANNNSKQKKINLSLDNNKKVVAKEVTQ